MEKSQITYLQRRYIEVVNHRVLELINLPHDNSVNQKYLKEHQRLNDSILINLERAVKNLEFNFANPLMDFDDLLSRDLRLRNYFARRAAA